MPYGLSVLHRTYPDHYLVGWRELNPRPKFLHTIFTITKTVIYLLKQYVIIILCLPVLSVFNVLPPICRH
ncbi:hypothetical protein CVX72_08860 [Salmonella enterica]|uniref:Uncharacterized protein n=1 Tax=Salmonella enterica TaxID=28901 RepID=A0A5V4BAX8_SALER|nr:hypothetical protein [Salmonella enterica]EBK1858266.1 hypothetical protein [Salmonella enterica subsp. enterica serovar Give]EAP4239878.1 hypothetical protein [Salmonella enterica]EBD4811356.1 hypothetical protein [Salmonella enterica]EBL4007149.1 hypothetical protein [Salmonella enterica subsp. enterica serovar Give]